MSASKKSFIVSKDSFLTIHLLSRFLDLLKVTKLALIGNLFKKRMQLIW